MSETHGKGDPIYAWQRFWVPRDGSLDLSDNGFLRDPQSEFARYSVYKLDTLRELQQFRGLGLLGEPGIGKSTTLQAEFKALQQQAREDGRVYIHVDLRSFSSDVLLHRRVFESPEFTAWQAGNTHLVLYLDSLDEALLRIDSVAALLADELPRHPTARMSIRIACRTAAWPHELLETALKNIWGADAVGVFEQAPLRRRDVIEAASRRQIDPSRFMEEIHKANAVPFAIKPLTLNLLFRIFQNSGHLPERIIDLYSQGCLGLCEEPSASRRGARRVGQLNGRQRYRLASRIAAVTMFANRFAIWTDPETDQQPDEDVPSSALSTGGETGDFQPFNASEDNLREVLDTGLFSSRGAARMGWAHQSYAEFLAADYLVTKQASPENILKILCHPSGGLIPQLWTVAAWVASRSEAVRSHLIAQEPFALLRGDLLSWSQSDLAALTDALLTAFHEQRAHDFGFGIALDYRKLAHPGLADQLRPYIIDPAKHVVARRAALMIARACSLRALQAELLAVALNPADDPSIRAHAVSVIGDTSDDNAIVQLLPLARGELGPDPHDEIKGRALQILWPNHLTSAELFQLITPPAQAFVGAYVMFLTRDLAKSLSEADLLPALQWATGYARAASHTDEFHTKELADGILMRSWEHIDHPDILCAFTTYVMLVMRRLHRIFLRDENNSFEGHIRENEAKRHQFLLAILKQEEPPLQPSDGVLMRKVFLEVSDLEWLLSISPCGTSPIAGINPQSLCALIQAVFNPWEPSQFEALYDVAMRWPPLHQRYDYLLDGVPLDSPRAAEMRQYHELELEHERLRPAPVDPPPPERVRMGLERFEAGDIDAWWRLNLELTLEPASTHYDELQSRIIKMPGWIAADEATRSRIIAAARKYLLDAQPLVGKWLGTNAYRRGDLAAYRALILLKDADPQAYERLDPAVWAKWAPVVVAVPKETGTENGKFDEVIASDACTKAPAAFARTVQWLIRTERRRSRIPPPPQLSQPPQTSGISPSSGISPFWILRTLGECWRSTALKEMVFAELKNRNNSPAQFEALLEPLLTAQFAPARDFAASRLTRRRLRSANHRPYAFAAATQLAAHPAGPDWPLLWQQVSGDSQFGVELFLKIAHEYRHDNSFYSSLTETQLGDLYIWLEQTFPVRQDPHRQGGGAFFAGPRDSVARLRDGILSQLVNKGTPAAVEALQNILNQLPDRDWLAYQLLDAEQAMRRKTWTPLLPSEIIRVTETTRGVLVQSAAQLADALLQALRRYERELHGEQTPIRDLWDRQANHTLRPVDENALSDHVQRFLKRDLVDGGIILNREVEIARVPGAGAGTRTDIKVDAIRQSKNSDPFTVITAVIETKGCWNDALLTAIRTQLVDDYLIRLAAPVGIYLVGWFDKAKWDPTDYRRGRTPDWSLDQAQSRLDQEAAGLPSAFIVRPVVLDCHAP
jgi:predicted NACHT family NTPase